MNQPLNKALDHLGALVAFDTQNPPREINQNSPIFAYLAGALGPAFAVAVTDHGHGRVSFFAQRGRTDVLFNVHLDTVPVLDGAQHDPLQMIVKDNRAWGRGSCDIKGAAACLLTLAQLGDAPMALLFTTDEEGTMGCCVREFIASGAAAQFSQVIVAEPTGCQAQFRHRGYLSVRGQFSGVGGHSSEARALEDNAIHRLTRWAGAALASQAKPSDADQRSCFNLGTVDGGVKSNVIADQANVFWSARLAPGHSNEQFLEQVTGLADGAHARWEVSFSGPPLPTSGQSDEQARAFAQQHGIPIGAGVDFWTEASLFGAAGIPAMVLGPGHIEQAHVVDEWVSLEQLEQCLGLYQQVIEA